MRAGQRLAVPNTCCLSSAKKQNIEANIGILGVHTRGRARAPVPVVKSPVQTKKRATYLATHPSEAHAAEEVARPLESPAPRSAAGRHLGDGSAGHGHLARDGRAGGDGLGLGGGGALLLAGGGRCLAAVGASALRGRLGSAVDVGRVAADHVASCHG